LHEVPYSLPGAKSSFEAGSIDALFREEGEWFLVEFKTDEIRPGDEIDWSSVDYLQQVENYINAAGSLLEQKPYPILCFLDYGGQIKLVTDRW
jgi:ATP-dependent exoDNAse (exonuclease V) beta subunit